MKKLLTGLVIVFLLMSQAALADFTDVDDSTDYSVAIEWMAANGVIDGHPDGSFKPDVCVNRAEMLKMLFEITGEDLNDMTAGGLYPDVPHDAWYQPYVKKATLMGIVQGYADGNFRPAQCVNRAEAIKMGMNKFDFDYSYLAYEGRGIMFSDLDFDEWYFPFVQTAGQYNLLGKEHVFEYINSQGYPERYYVPAASMTRKEVAEMLYRMKIVKDNGKDKYDFLDLPDRIAKYVNTEFGYKFLIPEFAAVDVMSGLMLDPELEETIWLSVIFSEGNIARFNAMQDSGTFPELTDKMDLTARELALEWWNINLISDNVVLSDMFEKNINGVAWFGFATEGGFEGPGYWGEPSPTNTTLMIAKNEDTFYVWRLDSNLEENVDLLLETFEFTD